MKFKVIFILFLFVAFSQWLYAQPRAVGILGKSKDCLSCAVNNGPWKDDGKTIIDILDKNTKISFKQPDGSFIIKAKRGEIMTILTVIGRSKDIINLPPCLELF